MTCQKSKVEHQKPSGLMQPLDISEWKWDSISMDFMVGILNTSRRHGTIWVNVDRLTKLAYFIQINIRFSLPKLVEIYIHVIVKLHEVPLSIVFDKGSLITSRFWEDLQDPLGTKLKLSSAYNPQTDRTIQSLEDLLRACILKQGCAWDGHLVPEWIYLKHYMVRGVGHLRVGINRARVLYLDQRLSNRLLKKRRWSEIK